MDHKEMQQDLEFIFPIISGKVSMAINRMLFRNFKREKLDITPEQWTVLAFLWNEDGVTQQKLCDITYKDKPSMTRLIDNLVKQGFVERRASSVDRRSNNIYLTDSGRSIEDRANAAVSDAVESALLGINDEGRDRVRSVLKLIFGNMQQALSDR
jgi:DNA-binding MarR family transcriptional regulator